MKSTSSRIFYEILLTLMAFSTSSLFAQTIRSSPLWARHYLQELGIDPNNKQMVIDSLRSSNSRVRFGAINYCGQGKIREALPILKEVFSQRYETDQLVDDRYLGDRAQILRAVIAMGDTSFHDELKSEIDSLWRKGKGRNLDYVIEFSSFLQEKHRDDYGFRFVYEYYSLLQDFVPNHIIIPISFLEPFVKNQYRDSLLPILRNAAVIHPESASRASSLRFLKVLMDPQLETLLLQAGRVDPDAAVRARARELLGELGSPLYVTALKEAARDETKHRSINYDLLIRTRQVSNYKYVLDILNQNIDPESNRNIRIFLENPYAFYPSETTPTALLLDSLVVSVSQILNYGWLADANFVNELDNGLDNAKKHLANKDSVNAYKEVQIFQEKVNTEYERTVDNQKKGRPRDKRFVTVEGWKFLYYNAQYIMDRLPGGKK